MTDPNHSITVTREELEREMEALLMDIWPEGDHIYIKELGQLATNKVFTNAKAREKGESNTEWIKCPCDCHSAGKPLHYQCPQRCTEGLIWADTHREEGT